MSDQINDLIARVKALEHAANGVLWPEGQPPTAAMEAAATQPPAHAADHSRGAPEMVATDEELWSLYDTRLLPTFSTTAALRAVYNLGRQHSAQPCQEEEAAPSPTHDLTSAAPLLWVLWHHLGASSPVGQPIRRYLGMGQHDRMTPEEVVAAKRWARRSMGVQDYLDSIPSYSSAAPEPAPPPTPDGGLLEKVAWLLANRISTMRPGADCTPLARDVLRVLADAAEKMARDPNLTWERVAIWLDVESEQ